MLNTFCEVQMVKQLSVILSLFLPTNICFKMDVVILKLTVLHTKLRTLNIDAYFHLASTHISCASLLLLGTPRHFASMAIVQCMGYKSFIERGDHQASLIVESDHG